MRYFRKHLILLLLAIILLLHPAITHAQTDWTEERGCVAPGFEDVATIKGLECLVENILVVAIQLIGLLMFIMLIVGGFRFLNRRW